MRVASAIARSNTARTKPPVSFAMYTIEGLTGEYEILTIAPFITSKLTDTWESVVAANITVTPRRPGTSLDMPQPEALTRRRTVTVRGNSMPQLMVGALA